MRARALGAGLVLGLVATPLITSLVDARPVADSAIALLANDAYVDTGTIEAGGEVVNVTDDLEAAGHTVTPFEDVSATGLTDALDGAEVLVIPELENDDAGPGSVAAAALADDMGAEGQAVMADFVDGGGRIVFFGSSDPSYFINEVFGFSVEGTGFCVDESEPAPTAAAVGDPCVLTAAAADTEWADGPATVNYVDDSTGLLPESLPAGSTIAYEGQTDRVRLQAAGEEPIVTDLAAVVSMPFGDGAVVYMGWDWYPDAEGETVSAASAEDEADWAVVLDLGVSQPTVTASSPAAGQVTFTSDSPSTQPVFVVAVVDGETITVTIPAKTTSGTASLPDGGSVAWSVPGWGVGEGAVEVLASNAAPVPVPAAPTFTG